MGVECKLDSALFPQAVILRDCNVNVEEQIVMWLGSLMTEWLISDEPPTASRRYLPQRCLYYIRVVWRSNKSFSFECDTNVVSVSMELCRHPR